MRKFKPMKIGKCNLVFSEEVSGSVSPEINFIAAPSRAAKRDAIDEMKFEYPNIVIELNKHGDALQSAILKLGGIV